MISLELAGVVVETVKLSEFTHVLFFDWCACGANRMPHCLAYMGSVVMTNWIGLFIAIYLRNSFLCIILDFALLNLY